MGLPILYSFRRCPYAMRARMAIVAAKFQCELREVSLSNKPAELVTVSPKATVPVLTLPNGDVLEESLDIMKHALATHDPLDWLSSATPQNQALIELFDRDFKANLDAYKYPNRHAMTQHRASTDHRHEALLMLMKLEGLLASQPFLSGAQMGFVDVALFAFVRQFASVDQAWFDLQEIPRVQAWLAAILATPLFDQVMTKYPVWVRGDDITLFGG